MEKERPIAPEEFFRINKPSTDHDGVIADTRTLVVEEFNERFGTNYHPTDIRDWDTVTQWALKEGLSDKEAQEIDDELWLSPDVLIKAKPVKGALEFTRWFYERGIFLPIITSRNPELIDSTVAWYKREMPWIANDQIIQRKNKEMDGFMFKAYIINSLQIGVHFDDSSHHTEDLLKYTNARIVLLTNVARLDHHKGGKLTRIQGIDGKMPDMRLVNQRFLGIEFR